jgi:hypothetical protein
VYKEAEEGKLLNGKTSGLRIAIFPLPLCIFSFSFSFPLPRSRPRLPRPLPLILSITRPSHWLYRRIFIRVYVRPHTSKSSATRSCSCEGTEISRKPPIKIQREVQVRSEVVSARDALFWYYRSPARTKANLAILISLAYNLIV